MPSAIAFADIAKKAKGLLGGDATTGNFVLSPKLTIATTTQCGVAFTTTATAKGEKLDATLKAAYSTKKYAVDATADPTGKVSVNASVNDVAPGVKLSGSVVLPDPAASAKVSAEYSSEAAAIKATVGLTASPTVDVTAATGYQSVLLGAEAGYDTTNATLTKYNFVLGYHAADFQFAALLTDRLSNLKLIYSHSTSASTTVGAELARKIDTADAPTSFALAYARTLANGAVAKLKLDNGGTLAAVYSTKLAGGEKLVGAAQVGFPNISAAPKYGFSLDLA